MHLLRYALLSLFVTVSVTASNPKVDEIVEWQRQHAVPRTMYIPYYSLAGDDETELYMVLKILDPLVVNVTAIARDEQIIVGEFVVPPSRGLSLNLREAIGEVEHASGPGVLRLDYVGNPGTLQAWAVVTSAGQTFEVPFATSQNIDVPERIAFWDMALVGSGHRRRVEYSFTNAAATPTGVAIEFGGTGQSRRVESFTLPPFGSRTIAATEGATTQRGWVRLTTAGSVVAAGIYRDGVAALSYSQFVPRSDAARGPRFEVIRLPVDRHGRADGATISLCSTGTSAQSVVVEVLRASDSTVVGSRHVRLDAEQVRAVDLKDLAGGSLRRGLRIRVAGENASFLVDGASRTASGEVLDMSVHAVSSAHRSGTYPIPNLRDHDVTTTIINLSDEPSVIAAQYFWNGGTFAVPLFTVPGHGAYELNPKGLAAAGVKDLAGRTLDVDGRALALKWSVWRGSQQLIGRTETRPGGTSDGFGFNCGGCCWQIPEVFIEPEEVELGIGDAPLFQAVMYEQTCSGRLGPWASGVETASVPWPFSWDFVELTTSAGADEYISFSTVAEQIDQMCLYSKVDLFALGKGLACKKVFNPDGYDKNRTCSEQTTTCEKCYKCCDDLYKMKVCQGHNKELALSELNACKGVCDIDRCI